MIDAMTLAEAGEIFAYWAEHPPAHLLLQWIAGALGWRPAAAREAPTDFAALAAQPPPGLASGPNAASGLPAALFDPAELGARNLARAARLARRNSAATIGNERSSLTGDLRPSSKLG